VTGRPRQPTVANQPRRTPLDRIHHTLDHILATLKEIAVKQAEYDTMIAPFLEVAKRIVDREANEAAEPALDTSAFTKAVADLDAHTGCAEVGVHVHRRPHHHQPRRVARRRHPR
jgi:hypothetical protein